VFKSLDKLIEWWRQRNAMQKHRQRWGAKQAVGVNGRTYMTGGGVSVRPDNRQGHRLTKQEVKNCLRGKVISEWSDEVLRHASQLGSHLDARMRRHFRGRERMFEKLPFVIYQYTGGKPVEEIARTVSYFSDGKDVEDAVDFAADLIAKRINRGLQP
jgi:hypothetical protein